MPEPTATAARSPLDTIPSASSPHLLTHLLEMVARGVRSTRGLEEALGVDPRTLRYYLHAARWLGLLTPRPDPVLSADGLAYVYAGSGRRDVYARIVRQHPFLADLLEACDDHAPDAGTIAHAIRRADPDLASSTVDRRASAIRSLLQPALEDGTPPEDDGQLTLPLAQVPRVAPEPPLQGQAGRAFSPDLYRFVLCTLLDHGELTLGHLRALLDHAGADDVPLGAYVDLALDRGDAIRLDERLVVTADAARRRDLASSTSSIILSDGGWRDALDVLRDGRATRTAGGYRLWFKRLLGREAEVSAVDHELGRVLQDRSLASFPVARAGPQAAPVVLRQPFLDVWEASGLVLALPSSLVQLWEGVRGIDRRLRNARTRADAIGLPTAAYRPTAVHGGLLHPGERLPRAIGDARALRLRAVTNAPYLSLLTAILLLPRIADRAPRVRRHHGSWRVFRGRRDHGPLLSFIEAFAADRGWCTSRLPHAGIDAEVLASLMKRLGLGVATDGALLLDDGFFLDLRRDEGTERIGRRLDGLAEAIDGWLDRVDRSLS